MVPLSREKTATSATVNDPIHTVEIVLAPANWGSLHGSHVPFNAPNNFMFWLFTYFAILYIPLSQFVCVLWKATRKRLRSSVSISSYIQSRITLCPGKRQPCPLSLIIIRAISWLAKLWMTRDTVLKSQHQTITMRIAYMRFSRFLFGSLMNGQKSWKNRRRRGKNAQYFPDENVDLYRVRPSTESCAQIICL